ncbi:helix-turn-helix transcriptional regulator [Rhodovulum steppense]|uniref:Uncharacterized protein n=1 Tax=Rhodovulum steppense TaxID=540251 RepID=A0A4R1YC14_9RHOB|nr:hypothetical protein [Rhodovulum steppense]TCM73514.1 hypothetical protein EV216_1493 [Rhodovulum steppense]
MDDALLTPGNATPEQLKTYFRLSSVRAAREFARRLGIRCVNGAYPWFSIWMDGEHLAQPPRTRWAELKLNHLTAVDLAEVLDRSPRTARRKAWNKPDASFPDPLVFGPRHRRWRAAQVHAWRSGLPVPVYPTAPVLRPPKPEDTPQNVKPETHFDGFNPFQELAEAGQGGRKND